MIGPRTTSVLVALITFSFGFGAIFSPWLHESYTSGQTSVDFYVFLYGEKFVNKVNGSTYSSFNSLHFVRTYTCANEDERQCVIATIMYNSASASLAFIVISIAGGISYCVISLISSVPQEARYSTFGVVLASMFFGILIFPSSAIRSFSFLPYILSWYSGFWVWLVASLLCAWAFINLISAMMFAQ